MNLRERFNRFVHFQEVDQVPNFEIGWYKEAADRWYLEGVPRNIRDAYVGPCAPKHVEKEGKWILADRNPAKHTRHLLGKTRRNE